MFEDVAALLITIIPYAVLGSGVRAGWGIYKAYTNLLYLDVSRKRLGVEFLAGILFGVFGGVLLTTLGVFTIGTSLGTLISSLLGANVIDLIARKFGWSKRMDVVVSDQQLGLEGLNARQMNAVQYARERGRITNHEYQRINRTTRDVAKHELVALVAAGKMRKVGGGKGASYVAVVQKAKKAA